MATHAYEVPYPTPAPTARARARTTSPCPALPSSYTHTLIAALGSVFFPPARCLKLTLVCVGCVFAQIKGVAFSSYSQSEIRKLSVKSIKNPTAFDTLGHPVDGAPTPSYPPPTPSPFDHVGVAESK